MSRSSKTRERQRKLEIKNLGRNMQRRHAYALKAKRHEPGKRQKERKSRAPSYEPDPEFGPEIELGEVYLRSVDVPPRLTERSQKYELVRVVKKTVPSQQMKWDWGSASYVTEGTVTNYIGVYHAKKPPAAGRLEGVDRDDWDIAHSKGLLARRGMPRNESFYR